MAKVEAGTQKIALLKFAVKKYAQHGTVDRHYLEWISEEAYWHHNSNKWNADDKKDNKNRKWRLVVTYKQGAGSRKSVFHAWKE